MRLTWRDAVSTVFMAAIVIIYISFLNSTTAWLISSARGTAGAVLILGMVGGCGMSIGRDQDQARAYTSVAGVIGAVALVSGVLALITASTVALAILVAATLTLWLVATLRHAFTRAPVFAGDRDTHEVIHPETTRR